MTSEVSEISYISSYDKKCIFFPDKEDKKLIKAPHKVSYKEWGCYYGTYLTHLPREDLWLDYGARIAALDHSEHFSHFFLKEIPAGIFAGSHENKLYVNEKDEYFLFKSIDPTIAKAEEAASRLGRLILGEKAIHKARFGYIDDQSGVLINVIKNTVSFGPNHKNETPSLERLNNYSTEIVRHHILDWLLSNHDGHSDNFLIKVEGKEVPYLIGIDKGQSWKWIEQDLLNLDYHPNPSKSIYHYFWKAVKNGKIVVDYKKIAEDLFKHIQDTVDLERFQAIIAPYVALRAGKDGVGAIYIESLLINRFNNSKKDWEIFLNSIKPTLSKSKAQWSNSFSAGTAIIPILNEGDPLLQSQKINIDDMSDSTSLYMNKKVKDDIVYSFKNKYGFQKTPQDAQLIYESETSSSILKSKDGSVEILNVGPATLDKFPKKWTTGHPGSGFSARIKYKEFIFQLTVHSQSPRYLILYPNSTSKWFQSLSKAINSFAFYAAGHPFTAITPEKKKELGIPTLSIRKILKLKDFKDQILLFYKPKKEIQIQTPVLLGTSVATPQHLEKLSSNIKVTQDKKDPNIFNFSTGFPLKLEDLKIPICELITSSKVTTVPETNDDTKPIIYDDVFFKISDLIDFKNSKIKEYIESIEKLTDEWSVTKTNDGKHFLGEKSPYNFYTLPPAGVWIKGSLDGIDYYLTTKYSGWIKESSTYNVEDTSLNPLFIVDSNSVIYDNIDTFSLGKVIKSSSKIFSKPHSFECTATKASLQKIYEDHKSYGTLVTAIKNYKGDIDTEKLTVTNPSLGGTFVNYKDVKKLKFPKKIYKSWNYAKKIKILNSLPIGTKIKNIESYSFTKIDQDSWLYETAYTTTTNKNLIFNNISKGGTIECPSVTTHSHPDQEAKKPIEEVHQKPAIAYTPPPSDPLLEEKLEWLKKHPALTKEQERHVAWFLKKIGSEGQEVICRQITSLSESVNFIIFNSNGSVNPSSQYYYESDSPFGKIVVVKWIDILNYTPEGQLIKGPDGKEYPHGTTFIPKVGQVLLEQDIPNQPGFSKWAEYKGNNTDKYCKTVKIKGNSTTHKNLAQTIITKYSLDTEIVQGTGNTMFFVSYEDLQKVVKETITHVPVIPIQPTPIRYKGLGISTFGVPKEGSPAPNNWNDIFNLDSIIPYRHGYSIRFGAGGVLMDGQLRLYRVKLPSGLVVNRLVGELTEDCPVLDKKIPFPFYSSSASTPHPFLPSPWKNNDFDPSTGTHTMSSLNIWKDGSAKSSGFKCGHGSFLYTFTNKTQKRMFVLDIPSDGSASTLDINSIFLNAAIALGISTAEFLKLPEHIDELITKKLQLLKSYWGATGRRKIVDLSLMSVSLENRLEKIESKLSKCNIDVNNIEIVIGHDNYHHVLSHDLDKHLIKKVIALGTHISLEGIVNAVIQGGYGGQSQCLFTGNTRDLNGKSGLTSVVEDMACGGGIGKFFRLISESINSHGGSASNKPMLLIHPRVLQKTNWYAADGDTYGTQEDNDYQKSRFDALCCTSPSNEFIIENVSIKDYAGALVSNAKEKTELLGYFSALGLKEINGCPIEDFVVVGSINSNLIKSCGKFELLNAPL